MDLHERIESDLHAAMKARDKARTSALRMAVAALKNRAIADGAGPQGRLPDAAVEQVLSTEVKRRREAATAFREAGREEQAASEEAEAEIYAHYLPEQLDDDAIAGVVDEVIAELDAQGPKQLGAVMKASMARLAGRADGSRVSSIAKQRLLG